MKRVIISWCILAAIVAYDIAGIYFINKNNQSVETALANLRIAYEDGGDVTEIMKKFDELQYEWRSHKKMLAVLIRDEKVSEIDASITKIKPLLLSDNASDFYSEAEFVTRRIQTIHDSEIPTLLNIL